MSHDKNLNAKCRRIEPEAALRSACGGGNAMAQAESNALPKMPKMRCGGPGENMAMQGLREKR